MKNQILRREIHPVVRVIDEKQGLVEYIASDESIDSYGEIVCAGGADFSRFQKNAPFVDSHNYDSIGCCLGKVVDFRVQGRQVVETTQWAIGMGKDGQDTMADWGFRMTSAGFLKAVSIGFMPLNYATKWDSNQSAFSQALQDMNVPASAGVSCIYLSWLQLELSACCIGANANAVARAYKAGVINDAALDQISSLRAKRETADRTVSPADVLAARQRARTAFLVEIQTAVNKL